MPAVGQGRGGNVLDRRDVLDLMHGRSRMAIGPRIPTMPRRGMSGFSPTRAYAFFACLSHLTIDHASLSRRRGGGGTRGRTLMQELHFVLATLPSGTHSWESRIRPRCGGRMAEVMYVSYVGIFFRGKIGRSLRLEGRRSAILGGRRLTALQWYQTTSIEVRFKAMKATRPIRGRLSCVLATTPRGRIPG